MDGTETVNTDGNSLLRAVYLSRLRLTRLLLEGGAYINESNERGETPLMVACKSRHTDSQSVSKAKMVKYLLESGADPNIQDKTGKTALMHACLNLAGPEVASLLLDSGADPSVEDHTGSSALVHAINAGDEGTLKMLMDACKAKGKEVIIITPDKLACARQMTKQYLKVPPLASLEHWDNLHSSMMPCASPSEIHLHTSQEDTPSAPEQVFSFQDRKCKANAPPTSSSHQPSPVHGRVEKLQSLQRLHSEPWLKIPQSFLAQQLGKGSFPTEELPDITPEEELTFQKRLPFSNANLTRHCSMDLKEAGGLNHTLRREITVDDDGSLRPEGALCRKMSFDGLSSLHSLSHPNLHSKSSAETITKDKDQDKSLPNLAVSSLWNIIQRRQLGVDHYSSDSQLSAPAGRSLDDHKGHMEKRRLPISRSSTLTGSREFLDNASLAYMHRRHPVSLERRGSGALLSEQVSHPRSGFLPPLTQHSQIPQGTSGGSSSNSVGSNSKPICSGVTGMRPCVPSAPTGFPKDFKIRKMLMRRHSMQTEQIKQLGDFKEICGH
ncbi:ankyrin repeat domain-containing protein 34B [Chanos chanos]|uniref:Ankyrin repeat domain-containing protein 34B n=1 Tax=Chanos chanos TaxID=29144 RepID=A0A6J2UYU5_CHACN|nr:ankyrin repeat domain-containing protein 34B-like [Chanos chanos]